ncbi:MAG TPA: hypothetical protein VER32_16220 [Pyrinomonadaceae bacterium]|nr:hypothetical protein [Pyrinomonadaceae bacterium]
MTKKSPRVRARAKLASLALAAALAPAALLSDALSSAASARAQSGRRGAPRTTPATTETTSNDAAAESRDTNTVAAKKPAVPYRLVVAGRFDTKNELRASVIFNKFLQRLGEASASATSLGLMKRDEALARARSEDSAAYFVWVQIEGDMVQDGELVFGSSDLAVKYQVYPPGSREAKGKGKVYYQAMGGPRARQDRFPSATPIKITPEAAGEEAAEMVLDWFRIVEGPTKAAREN